MANVFISHRIGDSNEAERLANALKAAGHKVWLDRWALDVGDSIIQEINDGLEGSTYLILCYSSAGVTSPWMGSEWMSTLARQLNGANVRLLPVRLTGGDPPAILADRKYADLVKDWSNGVSQLLAAIK
jgi:hypothetical protein